MEYIKKIKKIIADKTGHEPGEIDNDAFFEDDLNVGAMELMDILEELEDALHVDLVEERGGIETVNDLIEMVAEQVE